MGAALFLRDAPGGFVEFLAGAHAPTFKRRKRLSRS